MRMSNALTPLAAIGLALALPATASAQIGKPVVKPPASEQGAGKPIDDPADANTEGKLSANQVASIVANAENGLRIVRNIESYPKISIVHVATFIENGQREVVTNRAKENQEQIAELQRAISKNDDLVDKLQNFNVNASAIIGVGDRNGIAVFYAK